MKYFFSLILILTFITSTFAGDAKVNTNEARFLWLARWNYRSEKEVRFVIQETKKHGFNGIFFQVRGNGTVYFKSSYEPMDESIGGDTASWDPLAVAIDECRKQGIEIHAYVNVYPGWIGNKKPVNPKQLWYTHPEWFAVDKNGEPSKLSDGYHVLSPGIPEVKQYLNDVFIELVKKYDVDGLHLDYVRYYDPKYSYDSISLARFNAQYNTTPEKSLDEWNEFRRQQVTDLVRMVYVNVHNIKPKVIVSAATWGNWKEGYNDYFQDAHGWLAQGIIDFVCPMTYTHDAQLYEADIQDQMANTHGRYIFPGVGIFTMKNGQTLQDIMDVVPQYPNLDGTIGYTLFDWTGLYKEDSTKQLRKSVVADKLVKDIFKKTAKMPTYPWKKESLVIQQSKPYISKVTYSPLVIQPTDKYDVFANISISNDELATISGKEAVYLVYSDKYFITDYKWDHTKGIMVKPTHGKIKGIIPMMRVPGQTNQWKNMTSLTGGKAGTQLFFKIIAANSHGVIGDSELQTIRFYYSSGQYRFKETFGQEYQVGQFITLDLHQRVWICEYKQNRLRIFNSDGSETAFSPITTGINEKGENIPFNSPSGLSCDNKGFVYATMGLPTAGLVVKYDPETGKPVSAMATKYAAGDTAFDKKGNLYIVERIKPKFHIYDSLGKEYEGSPYSMSTAGSGQINRGIAVTADGKSVLIISESKGKVLRYIGGIKNGKVSYRETTPLTSIEGASGAVDIDALGNIYVSDLGNHCIQVFDRNYKHIADLVGGKPALSNPRGAIATPDGKTVYVVEMGLNQGFGHILKWLKQ